MGVKLEMAWGPGKGWGGGFFETNWDKPLKYVSKEHH